MEKILIADDNLQITRILSEFVKKEGYAPVVAEDGETAHRPAPSCGYDVRQRPRCGNPFHADLSRRGVRQAHPPYASHQKR